MASYVPKGGSPSRSNSNHREKIIVGFDPIVLKLDSDPEGVQREGKYGIDYQYICNDNSGIMWLPKDGRDAILATGARRGAEIEICKSQRGRMITYVATLLSDAREITPAARTAPQPHPVALPQPLTQVQTVSPLEEI